MGTLPSGIGIYQCPLVDILRSLLAFASPHPSFQSSRAEIASVLMMIHLLDTPTLPMNPERRHRRSRRTHFCVTSLQWHGVNFHTELWVTDSINNNKESPTLMHGLKG